MTRSNPNPIDAHVGARVKARRAELGMTQERLADHLGVTYQQVQKYEKGTSRITASRLQTIANLLKVPVKFFFEDDAWLTGAGEVPRTSDLHEFLLTKDGIALNKAFARIKSAKTRRAIIELTRSFADGLEGLGLPPVVDEDHSVHQLN